MMSEWKSNIPEGLDLDARYQPVRTDVTKALISKKTKEAFQDPKLKQKHKTAMENRDHSTDAQALEKRSKNPDFLKNVRKGIEEFRNDPVRMADYEKRNRAAYLKAKEDPAYWESYYAAIKVRDADPEYHKKRIDASKKKICRRVQTPLGVFDSITDAAKAHGMGNTETMRHRLKSPNFPGYFLLDDIKKETI
jgi:hypothetical protein